MAFSSQMRWRTRRSSSPCSAIKFIIIFFFFFYYYCFSSFSLCSGNNETDRLALLEIKKGITNDPNGFFNSWNDSSHFCTWPGIQCNPKQRITALFLTRLSLTGTLSPHIANISFLKFINLQWNSFHGRIPPQLGFLRRLHHLNASHNEFSGVIPANLSRCSELRILTLGPNKLHGTIPDELGILANLQMLRMQENNLTGNLPASLGNLSQLVDLGASYNDLMGRIPDSFGRLTKLSSITMGINQLTGEIPPSLYNLSSIRAFVFTYNQLEGSLPENIGNALPNIEDFEVSGNNLTGTIPESFCNASQLFDMNMNRNNFVGRIPNCLGNWGGLQWVDMGLNNLGHNSTGDFDFLVSLANCTKLRRLGISINNFGGPLPETVANLSSSSEFKQLLLGVNQITSVPDVLQNLIALTELDLPLNLLKGNIPSYLGKLWNLEWLVLHGNDFSGGIPDSMGNLTRLVTLDLSYNRLEGHIPASLGKCQMLSFVDFSENRLSGEMPREVLSLPSLTNMLNLSHNLLDGKLLTEIGNLDNLNAMDLSFNNLTGEIPNSIGNCKSLEYLFMQENSLKGIIPQSLASLKGLMELDLSRNKLTGEIPRELQNLKFFQYLNLSFNALQGEVPSEGVFANASVVSLQGNPKLCGGDIIGLHLPKCPSKETSSSSSGVDGAKRVRKLVAIIASASISVALLLSLVTFLVLRRRHGRRKQSAVEDTIPEQFLRISYADLRNATNGFSVDNLIGSGGFGKVYKGKLEEMEKPVAVKVLDLERERAYKSLAAECEALRNVRHRNLVRVLSFCSSVDHGGNEFKALVFEYMENGSLEDWLHNQQKQPDNNLSLEKRLDIAIDVASAIHYLHDLCETPIIHCDLKPSNVLIDGDMVGHVSDFGQARLVVESLSQGNGSMTSATGVKGTVGYSAPEYGMGSGVSKKGDVYSYGILVLEMFTRKRPTDEMFREGLNLRDFVKVVGASPGEVASIVDPILLNGEAQEDDERGRRNRERGIEKMKNCLVSILEVGVGCSAESPGKRMNIADAVGKLQSIRDMFAQQVRWKRI